jgi:fatty-acyl-CoA synthase
MTSSVSTLRELLERAARDRGDLVAYAEGAQAISYRTLLEEAGAIARHLAASGLRSEDRVALALPAGLDFMRFFWAIQLLGATSCALNPYVPAAALVRRALRVRPVMLVADDDELLTAAASAGLTAVSPRHPLRTSRLSDDVVDGDALAFLQPTSGTSGESRAVMIRHRNVMAVLDSATEALSFGPDDTFVSWVPPWHDLGLVRFVIGSVHTGAPCHIVTPSIRTIPEWLRTIMRVRATVTGAPDFAWRLATQLVKEDVDLSSLRCATSGGEPVRRSTIVEFEKRFGISDIIRPGYGLAEATLGVSSIRPGETFDTDERQNVSCGLPLPGVDVQLADDGELLVRSAGVFAGYFEAEEATTTALRDGWLWTGDYGHIGPRGDVYVLGRKRAMLKRGGAVLAPRELEEISQEVEGVRLAAAFGVPSSSASATEEIVVALEIDGGLDPEAVSLNVTLAMQQQLGFAPERVAVLKPHSISRTYNGKVRHEELRRLWCDGELSRTGAVMHVSG